MSNSNNITRKAVDAGVAFVAKMTYGKHTDREIRIVVEALREMLAERKRERASKKYLAPKQ